jgi:hypothetical protein
MLERTRFSLNGVSRVRASSLRNSAGPGLEARFPGSRFVALGRGWKRRKERKACRLRWRIHMEIHPQRLRFQRSRQYSHHVPDRVAQFQDPRIRRTDKPHEHSRCYGLRGDVQRCRSESTTTSALTRQLTCSTQPSPRWPWFGFNWRYDSGPHAMGSIPITIARARLPVSTAPIVVARLPPVSHQTLGSMGLK